MNLFCRRKHCKRSLLAAVFSVLLLLAGPVPEAFADSLREVAERVARQNDGKVIGAREVQRNGRRYYEIRILTRDGVVRTIRVPADDRSGPRSGLDRFSSPRAAADRETGASNRSPSSAIVAMLPVGPRNSDTQLPLKDHSAPNAPRRRRE